MTKELTILIMEICSSGAHGGYNNYSTYRQVQDCQIYMHKCVIRKTDTEDIVSKCIRDRGYSKYWDHKK